MDFHEHHPKRRGEDVFGLIVLAVSVVLLWQAYGISGFSALSSPGAFPMAAAASMVIASVIVVLGNARSKGALSDARVMPVTVAVFIGLVVAYAAALGPLGFLPASLIFLTLGMRLLYRRGGGRAFGLSLMSLIVVYVVFRLVFQVVLPEGIVPERDIIAGIGNLFGAGEAQ